MHSSQQQQCCCLVMSCLYVYNLPGQESSKSQNRKLTRLEMLMAPAEPPKSVTESGFPPKNLMFSLTHNRAASWSWKAQFPGACWSSVLGVRGKVRVLRWLPHVLQTRISRSGVSWQDTEHQSPTGAEDNRLSPEKHTRNTVCPMLGCS